MVQCGQNLIFKFKMFCKRWGFRILMLILDATYLPVLKWLISIIVPMQTSNPGYYTYRIKNSSNRYEIMLFHDFENIPYQLNSCFNEICYSNPHSPSLRLSEDLSLGYIPAVITPFYVFWFIQLCVLPLEYQLYGIQLL